MSVIEMANCLNILFDLTFADISVRVRLRVYFRVGTQRDPGADPHRLRHPGVNLINIFTPNLCRCGVNVIELVLRIFPPYLYYTLIL